MLVVQVKLHVLVHSDVNKYYSVEYVIKDIIYYFNLHVSYSIEIYIVLLQKVGERKESQLNNENIL